MSKYVIEVFFHLIVVICLWIQGSALGAKMYIVFSVLNVLILEAMVGELVLHKLFDMLNDYLDMAFRAVFDILFFIGSLAITYSFSMGAKIANAFSERNIKELESIPTDPIWGFNLEAIETAKDHSEQVIEVASHLYTFPFGLSMIGFSLSFYFISRLTWVAYKLLKMRFS